MSKLSGDGDLPQKPLSAERGRKLRFENLYGDFAVVLEILGEVHIGHSAATRSRSNTYRPLRALAKPGGVVVREPLGVGTPQNLQGWPATRYGG